MGSLTEEIPSYEALIHEGELPPINLKFILDCVSSVPLYDRLDINKGTLHENEKKIMESQAEKYNDKIKNVIIDDKIENYKDDFNKLEPEYSLEEFSDLFLKNLYNGSDNDELLISIKENTFDGAIQESTEEILLVTEVETYTPSKEFLEFFINTSNGKHDKLIVYEAPPSHELSSDVSSDEKDEVTEDKIKEMSYQLKFCDSSNSKFLEPIINSNKFRTFEITSDSNNSKIPTLKKNELFLSDSESENDFKKKQLPHQTNKDLKVLKNKRPKKYSREVKKNSESTSGEKKGIENYQGPRNHSVNLCTDQPKTNLDNATTSACNTNVLVSSKKLTNINENIKKGINKKQVNNEASSSGEEDWEDLAEKNLFLHSKTLRQKVSKKK